MVVRRENFPWKLKQMKQNIARSLIEHDVSLTGFPSLEYHYKNRLGLFSEDLASLVRIAEAPAAFLLSPSSPIRNYRTEGIEHGKNSDKTYFYHSETWNSALTVLWPRQTETTQILCNNCFGDCFLVFHAFVIVRGRLADIPHENRRRWVMLIAQLRFWENEIKCYCIRTLQENYCFSLFQQSWNFSWFRWSDHWSGHFVVSSFHCSSTESENLLNRHR